jgi:hypothetical protein
MPRFAVILHVCGPFKEPSSPVVHDGAYTCRFLRAENADGASAAAMEALRNEPRFQCFRAGSLDGRPALKWTKYAPLICLKVGVAYPATFFMTRVQPMQRRSKPSSRVPAPNKRL